MWVERGDDLRDQDIFLLGTAGRQTVNLTEAAFRQSQPSWSPDGGAIAYTSNSGIHVMRADGSGNRIVTYVRHPSSGTHFYPYWPTWSPDGTRLAFVEWEWDGSTNLSYSLVTISLDGTDRRVLASSDSPLYFPDWSPDGSRIAFMKCAFVGALGHGDRDCMIGIVDGSGKGVRFVSGDIQPWDFSPTWIDNDRLVFTSSRRCFDEPYTSVDYCGGIYSMDSDGSNATLIEEYGDWTGDEAGDLPFRAIWVNDSFVLVPLGLGPDYEQTELWRLNPQTGQKKLIFSGDTGSHVDWQPICSVRGTGGDDVLNGTEGRDLICGHGGDDVIRGLGGDDVMFGHAGRDRIIGGPGRDIVVGNAGRDICDRDERDHSRVC